MLLHIEGVLSKAEVGEFRQKLAAEGEWVDGRVTVGQQGAQVKRNQQLRPGSALAQELGQRIQQKLAAHPQFFSAALPLRTLSPLFNRYAGGGHYGLHVDGAVMNQLGSMQLLRSDVSTTLFLSEPDEYQGGELEVKDTYGLHEVKLPAGDLVLYPSTSLHQVLPVSEGERVAAFFWTQSMIRDDARRAMLYELDQSIQSLRGRYGEIEEAVALSGHYHNLLRQWAEL
ncbi:Fe2+-dependent dioxygenase [Paucibacter sp. Y2R2-4]|uniref:Fe2+-dependent dioxygenase n=1 Tax=Paucibacter sp. Y2R2-4 TaxID=2893553 RepID=UPI0021E3B701|nr:Fe2+-dependent dioxygenase [Paucibacter sp. Y2R2-4]MCV2348769.1 Fe2+-dependent dioxygenase [Paucibacter sp. Y2R2-4]